MTTEDFAGRVLGDTAALLNTVMASLGDQLGLWKDLAAAGPATADELARRMGLSERHVREWLAAMAAAGYLTYRPESKSFCLPAEHAPVLAEESGPMFFGGAHQCVLGYLKPFERILETFRTGGGVPQSAYPDSTYDGMERFTRSWFENHLLQTWIPAADLHDALESGIDVCDVGCGRGRALLKLAEAYPRSRFVGYDVFGPNVQRAREHAARAGLAVRFEQLDVARGLPAPYDLVTTFDVVHDAADPLALLRAIRAGLRAGGRYLCLEIKSSHRLEDNAGPIGAFLHGCSVLYCMTTSLAHGGVGLGTCGLHEAKLRELAGDSGFDAVRRVEIGSPFNELYLLTAHCA